jgi:hypothetical protein
LPQKRPLALVSILQSLAAGEIANSHLDLLEPIYTWFTEDFDVADLLQAKALLDTQD